MRNSAFPLKMKLNFAGTSSPILWGESHFVGEELFWCCPECEAPVKVPVPVIGDTKSGPFFLVSEKKSPSSLRAVSVQTNFKVSSIFCLHGEQTVENCSKKSKILVGNPEWERLFGGDFN